MSPDQARLRRQLEAEGLEPGSWSNGPGDRYDAHVHGYDKVLVCAEGSIRFGLPDIGRAIRLGVGDRLDLPAGTRHDALAGPDGVTCLEAHLPAGGLPQLALRAAATWIAPASGPPSEPDGGGETAGSPGA